VHTDLYRPMRTKGMNGEQYFILLIDNFKIMITICFLKKNSKEFECFEIFKEMVENEADLKIKFLRSDNGDFTTKEFMEFCEDHGIKRQFSAARTPHKNGVVERKNRTLQDMARTMLKYSKLINIFWVQEIHTVIHILNK